MVRLPDGHGEVSGNGTPRHWRKDGGWKYGPTKLVVSNRPDPLQLPETAGESGPPSARQPSFGIIANLAFLMATAAFLAALYLLADWMVQVR